MKYLVPVFVLSAALLSSRAVFAPVGAGGGMPPTTVVATGDVMLGRTVEGISAIAPAFGKGEVVFMKDNPSGLPQYDAEVRVPVIFTHPQ